MKCSRVIAFVVLCVSYPVPHASKVEILNLMVTVYLSPATRVSSFASLEVDVCLPSYKLIFNGPKQLTSGYSQRVQQVNLPLHICAYMGLLGDETKIRLDKCENMR